MLIFQVHPLDNVRVALEAIPSGTPLAPGLTTCSAIPAGHKVAAAEIPAGALVIKYGHPIGRAKRTIHVGEHVHVENLESHLHGRISGQSFKAPGAPVAKAAVSRYFQGFRRPGGRVGIRNEIWVLPTVGCVNQAAAQIALRGHQKWAGQGIDGVYTFSHPFGCSQLGDDLIHTRRVLAGLMQHPNAAAVLVVGLGCENNQMASLLEEAGGARPGLRYFNAQDVPDEIETGLLEIDALAEYARGFQREKVPAGELILGMKCGGSDGFSGLTANPLVGRIADRATAQGATTLLTEVPEMFGAEEVLLARASDEKVFGAIGNLINDFRESFEKQGQPIDENPSPGNKAGGLSSNAEKSLGCVQKGGKAPIREVLAYGQRVSPRLEGVALLNAPGNDGVSATAMTVAGAQMILFTTGRGTPMGFPVPTLKIASNSPLAARKPSWIDFDAGRALSQDPEALADDLFDKILAVASGESLTRNEINAIREISIWKNGVTL